MNKTNFDNIPASLKACPNWVGFKVWWEEAEGRLKKLPIDIKATAARRKSNHPEAWKDVMAESDNPGTWCDFDTAAKWLANQKHHKKYTFHIGFAFDGGGICGIDLDKCVDENGTLSDFAKDILSRFPSYAEYSPSGKGVHILIKMNEAFPGGGINRKEIELYGKGRFFTMTGNILVSSLSEVVDCTDAMLSLYKQYHTPLEGVSGDLSALLGGAGVVSGNATTAAVNAPGTAGAGTTLSDTDIIEKARNSRNGSIFDEYWCGGLCGQPSQSEADIAFCNMLAFWTGKDALQMDRLFRASGLYRKKWDERHGNQTYGIMTIAKAIANCRETYTPPVLKSDKSKKERKPREPKGEPLIAEVDNEYRLVQSDGQSRRLTNFIIKPNRRLVTDEESIYVVTLLGSDGRKVEMQLKASDLVSAQSIKKKIGEREIGWSFLASDKEFELIKEHINSKPCPVSKGFKGIGMLPLASDNIKPKWVYAGERFALDSTGASVSGAESVSCENPIRSSIEDREEISRYDLEQVGRALLEYNETTKTLPILCYMAACLVKPKLNDKGIKFPHLVIVGESASGKSFTTEKVIQSFFSLGNITGASKITPYTFLTSAGASNCIPMLIDEYKPSTMRDLIVDNIHNGMRDLYDGHEGARGNRDMSVKRYPLTAPLVLIGEESPSEPALRERCIELLFSKSDIKDKFSAAALIEQSLMQDRIKQLGKASLLVSLDVSTIDLRREYDNYLRLVPKGFTPRIQNNIAVLCVGAYVLDRVCKKYGTTFADVFGIALSEVLAIIADAVKKYTLGGGLYNKSVIDQAFDTIDAMVELLRVEVHYKKLGSLLKPEIAFDIKRIYPKYQKYRRDCGLKGEVLDFNMFRNQLQKKDYFLRLNHPVLLKEDSEHSTKSHTVKCYVLDVRKLAAACDISNILERCGIKLEDLPKGEQIRFDEAS